MEFSIIQEKKKKLSKYFSNRSDTGLTNELLYILIILMEISQWQSTLFTSSDVIIFGISSRLKSSECSLHCVRKRWLVRKALSFHKWVHCSTNNLFNISNFVFIFVTSLSYIKEVDSVELFCYHKTFLKKTSNI